MRRLLCLVPLVACNEYDLYEHTQGDTFFQIAPDAAADVLFVVDDSASMTEEQSRLAENFSSFIDAVATTEADWQLGVVTTDLDSADAGLLRGGIFDPDTPDLEAAVVAALLVGAAGSRDERGFDAVRAALAAGANPGFLREAARLNVVFFSDEDDHSLGTVEDFLLELDHAAGDAGFAVHGVVGDLPDGCASGAGAAGPGPRYAEAIETSGGWSDSICAEDYAELLTRVGFEAAGLLDTFYLSAVPKSETIEVRVDSVLIPGRDVDGWTYSPGDNAIVFHGRSIPRPGMQIVVDYRPLVGAVEPAG